MSERTPLEIAAILEDSMPICGRAAVIALRRQHAEIERLTSSNTALTAKSNEYITENAWLTEKINRLTAEKFRRFNNEACWIYQRNGENHLDTLKCPVVISPEELLSMQGRHAEIERLTILNSALTAKGNAFVIENARQAEKIDNLTAERDTAIAAAVAVEREACAAVCEDCTDGFAATSEWDEAALWCARTIRARPST